MLRVGKVNKIERHANLLLDLETPAYPHPLNKAYLPLEHEAHPLLVQAEKRPHQHFKPFQIHPFSSLGNQSLDRPSSLEHASIHPLQFSQLRNDKNDRLHIEIIP